MNFKFAWLLAILAACDGPSSVPPQLASIALSAPDSLPLAPGDTARFQAVAKDQFGSAFTGITWRSLQPTVATVDGAGVVRALAPGDATITAGAEAMSVSVLVHVYRTAQLRHLTTTVSRVCGLDARARLYCWGNAEYNRGELADGINQIPETCTSTAFQGGATATVPCRTKPAEVALNGSVLDYDIAPQYGCAIVVSGKLYCWGQHPARASQTQTVLLPEPVAAPAGAFTRIITNQRHACALADTSVVYCWTGSPTAIPVNIPATVISIGTRRTLLANNDPVFNRTCATDSAANVYCWGTASVRTDAMGALVIVPEKIPAFHNPVFVFAAPFGPDICALSMNGEAYCTGPSPDEFRLVDPAHTYRQLLNRRQPCGITTAGQLYCTDPVGNVPLTNILLTGLSEFVESPSAGSEYGISGHYCFTQEVTRCYSDNAAGQLGIGYARNLRPPKTAPINADLINP